jgi:integral membrane protein
MNTENPTISWFRKIAIAEGISFLVLLGIAMPLKYFAGWPDAVTYTGWAHGVLFVLFLVLAIPTRALLQKNFFWLVKAVVASLLPFGTFVLERQMRQTDNQV